MKIDQDEFDQIKRYLDESVMSMTAIADWMERSVSVVSNINKVSTFEQYKKLIRKNARKHKRKVEEETEYWIKFNNLSRIFE